MSAFLVHRRHIDALVTLTIEGPTGVRLDRWPASYLTEYGRQTPDGIGRALWRANLASVKYRYPEDKSGDRPGPIGLKDSEIKDYTYTPGRRLSVGEAVQALSCFEYQACEYPAWRRSYAYELCNQLYRALAKTICSDSPGLWDITD